MDGLQAGETNDDAVLAVVLRQAQWLLDDVAHDLPAGRVEPVKHQQLATLLESLAGLLRRSTWGVVTDAARARQLTAPLDGR